MASWDVWRRMSGTRGENDCWSREVRGLDAETAEAAVAAVAADMPSHLLGEYLAVRTECCESYFVRDERETTRTVIVEPRG